MVGIHHAGDILGTLGWLSRQPVQFRDKIVERAIPATFARGQVIYRQGDAPGGIYGIARGVVIASFGHGQSLPNLLHVLTAGDWIGEGPFLSRSRRRVELRAATETSALYLPLEAMDQIATQDAEALRSFVQIAMLNNDVLMRTAHDLQDPDEHRRVARALRRVIPQDGLCVPLTQATVGMLANTSRKTVNAAVQRFERADWVRRGYRSITLTDRRGLIEFAECGCD